jgi:transcriptional regulator with GAF, ATPase, and Fis domain
MTAFPEDREKTLAAAFVSLADTLVDDYDVIDLMDRLTTHCVELIPADAAGLLLADRRRGLNVVSSSTEHVKVVELFQLEADEGPCLDCFRSSRVVAAPDLRTAKTRWPRFVARAQAEGFQSVYAVPLRLRAQTIGALNLFSARADALAATELRLAQALADVATIGILQERAIRDRDMLAEQLQSAVTSRVIIEQAKGVLAERSGLDMPDAFAVLRGHARRTNRRLSDLARDVVNRKVGTDDVINSHGVRKR